MADTLIVYFTRSGMTGWLASQLAAKLGADLDFVKPHTSYKGRGGYLKGIWHALCRRAPVVDCERDPANYATVIVGSPVWAGRLSPPMRGYLTRFSGQIGPLAAFWISGSGAAYTAVSAEIEQLTGRTLLTTASFGEGEIGTVAADTKLETIAQSLRASPTKVA